MVWKPNQQCYHLTFFLVVIHLLRPSWSSIYLLHGASPSADLVRYPSSMEEPPLPSSWLDIFWSAGQGTLAQILPPCSESPRPSAIQLGRYIFRRKSKETSQIQTQALGMLSVLKAGHVSGMAKPVHVVPSFSQLVQNLNLQGKGLSWA